MKKRRSISVQWMMVLFVVIVAAVWFAGKSRGNYKAGEYSADWIGIAEIKSELCFDIYAEEDWDAWFSVYHKEYLTGDMAAELLKKLGADTYIELSGETEKDVITRAEWNQVYGQLLDLLDMEKEVEQARFLVLDTMEAAEANVIITNEGDYYTLLPVSFFEKWQSYQIYAKEETCLGIVGVSEEETAVNNAYLKSAAGGTVTFLFGGDEYGKETGELETELTAGVCDLVFVNGKLSAVRTKQDVITGGLLSYDATAIEIEGYGKISHQGKIPVYQTYGEVVEKSISDVILGNMEVEYVTGEELVCAILIRQPAEIKNIRVLLLAEDGGKFRSEVYLKSSVQAVIKCGDREEAIAADTPLAAADYLAADPSATLMLTPDVAEGQIYICDSAGTVLSNGYAGTIEARAYGEGYTLVNCLPFETYLGAVVPSEMPSSYAPEALKAQAVCSRSYAYIQLLRADLAEYGAHINDSTSYQVYNKVSATEASIAAVNATAGQVLTYQGQTIEAYYFSTSMGYTDTVGVWNVEDPENTYGYLQKACLNQTDAGDLSEESAFWNYISTAGTGYDSDIKYYRWFAAADYSGKTEEINQILSSRRSVSPANVLYYEADGVTECESTAGMGTLNGISVAVRSTSGSILTLKLQYEKGIALVKTEYNIRKVLGAGVQKIVYQDGSESSDVTMLPSAFCSVNQQSDGTYLLTGGGYGHGLGMSQNAANGMAKAGMGYEEILQYFYHDVKIEGMK